MTIAHSAVASVPRRRRAESDEQRDADAAAAKTRLPALRQAAKRSSASLAAAARSNQQPPAAQSAKAKAKAKKKLKSGVLSPMDERVLILYHSALKQSWAATATTAHQQTRNYPHEATFAATQIQRVFRGGRTRTRLAAFDGPRYQRAATRMQFAFRWLVTCRRVARRVHRKRVASATRLQSWFRGCRCRERLLDAKARELVQRVVLLQRRFRGYRFWRVVAAMLHDRRCKAATEIQRLVRGWRGRRYAAATRFEQQRFVRNLAKSAEMHRRSVRCDRCELDSCTEGSLFDCFMARFVGLHDFRGARALCVDGVTQFPSSGRFCFFYAVLQQVLCEDTGVAMQYLHRALRVLGLSDEELAVVRSNRLRC